MDSALDDHGRITIEKPWKTVYCSWSNQTLPADDHAVLFTVEYLNGTTTAFLSAKGVADLIGALEAGNGLPLSDAQDIEVADVTDEKPAQCVICDSPVTGTALQIHGREHKSAPVATNTRVPVTGLSRARVGTVGCHMDCVEALHKTLDNIWNHSDVLLEEHL